MSLTWRRSRITGAGLVAAQYDLTLERQTIMDNILFIPGIANPVSEINQLLFGQGQPGGGWIPSFSQAMIAANSFGSGVTDILDLSGNNNPFSQATPSSRGAWFREPKSGRRNLLDATATLSTQSVTVAAVQKTLSFRGTGTVTLSGASTAGPLVGTGVNDIVSLTFTPSAGSLTLTVSGTVNDAQLNTGATRGAYQNVVSAFDITEAGQRDCYGVRADGTDDFYTTASTDFTGTDKVTVFAAVRKLSDALRGLVCELSPSPASNNGTFTLEAPSGNFDDLSFFAKGTTIGTPARSAIAAPITQIMTCEASISGPLTRLRLNGVQVASNTSTLGTGSFGNHQLFLGSRGGTSLFFNGNHYALIVAGGSYPASTIERVERLLSRITPTVNL